TMLHHRVVTHVVYSVLLLLFFIFLFFFYGSDDLHLLHSFPTRRSSDLGLRPGRDRPRLREPHGVRAVLAGTSAVLHRGGRHFRLDRKSTRLNSSHDQISYAVFCLKKKKKHPLHLVHEVIYKNLIERILL